MKRRLNKHEEAEIQRIKDNPLEYPPVRRYIKYSILSKLISFRHKSNETKPPPPLLLLRFNLSLKATNPFFSTFKPDHVNVEKSADNTTVYFSFSIQLYRSIICFFTERQRHETSNICSKGNNKGKSSHSMCGGSFFGSLFYKWHRGTLHSIMNAACVSFHTVLIDIILNATNLAPAYSNQLHDVL